MCMIGRNTSIMALIPSDLGHIEPDYPPLRHFQYKLGNAISFLEVSRDIEAGWRLAWLGDCIIPGSDQSVGKLSIPTASAAVLERVIARPRLRPAAMRRLLRADWSWRPATIGNCRHLLGDGSVLKSRQLAMMWGLGLVVLRTGKSKGSVAFRPPGGNSKGSRRERDLGAERWQLPPWSVLS